MLSRLFNTLNKSFDQRLKHNVQCAVIYTAIAGFTSSVVSQSIEQAQKAENGLMLAFNISTGILAGSLAVVSAGVVGLSVYYGGRALIQKFNVPSQTL